MTPPRVPGDRAARGARQGQSAVELALVLPVLLVLVVGVVDWGYLFGRQLDLVQVARDAAAAGSRVRSADGPAAHARTRCLAGLTAAGFDTGAAVVTVTMGTATAGTTLRVAVQVPYTPLGGLVPVPSTLGATTTLRMQNK